MSFPFLTSVKPIVPETRPEPTLVLPEDSVEPRAKILWFGSAPAVARPINTVTEEPQQPDPRHRKPVD